MFIGKGEKITKPDRALQAHTCVMQTSRHFCAQGRVRTMNAGLRACSRGPGGPRSCGRPKRDLALTQIEDVSDANACATETIGNRCYPFNLLCH
jgi:hypothetical protein